MTNPDEHCNSCSRSGTPPPVESIPPLQLLLSNNARQQLNAVSGPSCYTNLVPGPSHQNNNPVPFPYGQLCAPAPLAQESVEMQW